MKAAVLWRLGDQPPYANSDALTVEDVVLAPPGAGEVLVRVEAAGLCHSDLSVINGSRPRPVPMALGHEAAGVIEETGPGVTDVSPGDHVVLSYVPSCGHCPECAGGAPALCSVGVVANTAGHLVGGGSRLSLDGQPIHHHLGVSGFAERAVVSRGSLVVIPDHVPLDVGAMLGCAVLTGFGAVVNTAGVRPGETVAVFGLGGVGLSAVMAASLAGACPVIAVDPVAAKRDLATSLGATHTIDPMIMKTLGAHGTQSLHDHGVDAVEAVRELTSGGADHVIECVGSARVLEDSYRATRRGGSTVAVGLPHPDHSVSLPAVSFAGEGRVLRGSYMGSSAPARDIPRLIRLWEAGRLPVEKLRSGEIEFDGLAAAFDELDAGNAVRQILRPTPPNLMINGDDCPNRGSDGRLIEDRDNNARRS